MDTVRLSRSALTDLALHRQPDDHAAAYAPIVLESDADRADHVRLAEWLASTEGAPVDPARLVQSGPADHPLKMPVQPLKPAWFTSLLEIVGIMSWRRAPEAVMISGDA